MPAWQLGCGLMWMAPWWGFVLPAVAQMCRLLRWRSAIRSGLQLGPGLHDMGWFCW